MSPAGLDPEIVRCWARALAPAGKRYVFIQQPGQPVRYLQLVGDEPYPLDENPLISIDRPVTFGVDIDHDDGLTLATPYLKLGRHFLSEAIPIISGRPGHVHVLVSVYDKTDLRARLEKQVIADRARYGPGVSPSSPQSDSRARSPGSRASGPIRSRIRS